MSCVNTKEYLFNLSLHVGEYKLSARSQDFNGWLLCDGRSLANEDFSELYNVVGVSFGGGEGTFALPDLRGRAIAAIGHGAGLTSRNLGDVAGSEQHSLTIPELPGHTHTGTTDADGSHTHSSNATGNNVGLAYSDGNTTITTSDDTNPSGHELNLDGTAALSINSSAAHAHAFTTNSAGDGEAISLMQPTLFVGNLFIFAGIVNYPPHDELFEP